MTSYAWRLARGSLRVFEVHVFDVLARPGTSRREPEDKRTMGVSPSLEACLPCQGIQLAPE